MASINIQDALPFINWFNQPLLEIDRIYLLLHLYFLPSENDSILCQIWKTILWELGSDGYSFASQSTLTRPEINIMTLI